jgi:hypothetical protein
MLRARAHELDQSGDLGFIVGVVFCALLIDCLVLEYFMPNS